MIIAEIIATITGIVGVALQAKERIEAWPFAIISVSISAYLFCFSKLYSDFGLHVIYIFLNLFGWWVWSQRNASEKVISTKVLTGRAMIISIIVVIMGALGLGYVMDNHTDADLAYFDAFTTSGSLVAQYLLAKKYLQNWLLWIVVDIVAIPVYIYKELYFIAFLFLVFLGLSIWGYYAWRSSLPPKFNTNS